LTLHVLDTTEPITVAAMAEAVPLETTMFVVSSKSGGTIEPNSLFKFFWGLRPVGSQFIAITDPGTKMGEVATEHGFRHVFVNDPEIGGRYSALSYFGLVPAALAGIDVEGQLHAAEVAEQNCADWSGPKSNSGLWLGVVLGVLAQHGRDKLGFIIDAPVESFGLWVEQLIAESTGKQGRGVLPIADEPIADPGAYGDDRVFLHVRNADAPDEVHEAAVKALAADGHPTITVQAHGPGDLGRLFFFSEFATAVAGWVLGINPFDQPNVQEAKDNTARVLAEGPPELDEGSLASLLDGLSPPSYLAILGYLPYDPETDEAVTRLRSALLSRYGVPTTWGYGPRYLHSTGQYHKGGPPEGRFLELVHDGTDDLEVPGEPFGLRQLISAQADGDLQTLRSHGLPAVRVTLAAGGIPAAIDELTAGVLRS
jgi:glucose-6-phosphate isomerase